MAENQVEVGKRKRIRQQTDTHTEIIRHTDKETYIIREEERGRLKRK